MADAKIAVLIESEVRRGTGSPESRLRIVRRFSDAYGTFVAEADEWGLEARVREIVSRYGGYTEGRGTGMTMDQFVREVVQAAAITEAEKRL